VTIRTLIVDDEPLARRRVRRLLTGAASVEVIGECGDGESAVAAIREQKPDLVFLDVQMPEMSGFDVVRCIGPDAMPTTVFVTAYDEYAIPAFDANAIDYLLKPIGKERFARALRRAKERIAGKLNVADVRLALASVERAHANAYADRLTVLDDGRILLVSVDDITWLGVDGNYVQVHAGSRTFAIRETLGNLEAKLDPRHFARIHRSTIVNIRRIKEIQPWFHGHHIVILDTGEQLRMSRYQREAGQQLGIVDP
jgi:two-component system, LytTR family, response regulator